MAKLTDAVFRPGPSKGAGGSAKSGKDPRSELIRKGITIPKDMEYKLRMASARQRISESEMVRQALSAHLGFTERYASLEPVFLPPEVTETLKAKAEEQGRSPDELAAEILARHLDIEE